MAERAVGCDIFPEEECPLFVAKQCHRSTSSARSLSLPRGVPPRARDGGRGLRGRGLRGGRVRGGRVRHRARGGALRVGARGNARRTLNDDTVLRRKVDTLLLGICHNRPRVPPWRRPSGSGRAKAMCGEAARRACTAGNREGITARSAPGKGSASTGGGDATARSAGARASASMGGSEASARSAGAQASASTGGIEASARSAGARASASTGGIDTTARSAGALASASTGDFEPNARSAGAGASASTGGSEASARSAARLATRRLPCSAPPCAQSPRSWSSAMT